MLFKEHVNLWLTLLCKLPSYVNKSLKNFKEVK